MISDVFREKQRLDGIFALVTELETDEELLAHWAKYLCVLTSGFIENSLRVILTRYATDKANPQVSNFVESSIKGITNLNEERIGQLLGAFSSEWRERFTKKRTDMQKSAIDSVIANRHLIVHGRPVGLTIARMKDYYREVVKAIILVDEECVNPRT
jgi:hypothetical protein